MLKINIYCIVIIVIVSCNNSGSVKKTSLDSKDDTAITYVKGIKELIDTTDFFSNCDELIHHSTLGSLQGVEASKDFLQRLYFGDCFDYCKETFQIIFAHKDINKRTDGGYNSITKEFENGCSNYFKNFECFAFVCPMRDPDKQKDIHALNIDFPVVMRIYERVSGDNWSFIKKVVAKTFEEYALIRFKTIHHLN